MSNKTLYTDLGKKYVGDVIKQKSGNIILNSKNHDYPLAIRFNEREDNSRLRENDQLLTWKDNPETIVGRLPVRFF